MGFTCDLVSLALWFLLNYVEFRCALVFWGCCSLRIMCGSGALRFFWGCCSLCMMWRVFSVSILLFVTLGLLYIVTTLFENVDLASICFHSTDLILFCYKLYSFFCLIEVVFQWSKIENIMLKFYANELNYDKYSSNVNSNVCSWVNITNLLLRCYRKTIVFSLFPLITVLYFTELL